MHLTRTPQPGPTITPRDLMRDRRGAVVVMAVFMSIFLVGCLWYLIGIGEAAIYRERVDAGADAVAYTAAVYHARGMNMIAMINLIIAASLALVVIAKTLNYIVGVVYYATRFICTDAANDTPPATDPACTVAKDAGNRLAKLALVLDQVGLNGDSLIASLSQDQRDIGLTTPWVASTESVKAADNYDPVVEDGVAISPSMVPNPPRSGLPIMDEPFERTCQRGQGVAPEMLAAVLPPTYNEYLMLATGKSIEDTMKGYPKDYCGDSSWVGNFDNFDENDVCATKEKDWKEKWKKEHDWQDPPSEETKKFNEDCAKKEDVTDDDIKKTMDDNDIPDAKPEDGGSEIPEATLKTAKMLVPGAVNGNDYFQVYSTVSGDVTRMRRPDKGVEIASGGKTQVGEAGAELERYGLGQAEFYYDQDGDAIKEDRCWNDPWSAPPPCGLTWNTYKENTLWNMRWRARLRPFHMPTEDNSGDVGGIDDILTGGLPSTAPISETDYIPPQIGIINKAVKDGIPTKYINFRLKFKDVIVK